MSTELVCGGVRTSESEFQVLPSSLSGTQLTAACGPNALAAAMRWADQSTTTPSTVAVYQAMRAQGLGTVTGASTISALVATAKALHYTVIPRNAGESVTAFLARQAVAGNAVVLEVAAGANLKDSLTGYGEDAGPDLQFHYITVWGTYSGGADVSFAPGKALPAGYLCSDGDNDSQNLRSGVRYHWPLNQRMVYYPAGVLALAQPYDAFAVLPRVAIPGRQAMATIPSGWTDDATAGVLTAPNGQTVLHGFRDYVLNNGWDAGNVPLEAEQSVDQVELSNPVHGAGHIQRFHRAQLSWTPKEGVFLSYVGNEAKYLREALATATAKATDLSNQLAAAQAQIAALEQQIANMPPPPPPDPLQVRALDVMTRFKALLGEL